MLRLRVLTWNLGPGGARWQDLAAALAGWEWDVALLRGVPARWPVAVATALDAEFRCATADGAGWLRRLLGSGPGALRTPAGRTDAILARYDRIVGEWPDARHRAPEPAVSAARLGCGVWVGTVRSDAPAASLADAASELGREPVVLAGARPTDSHDRSPSLRELARDGADGLWASTGLVPVGDAELLAEATEGGGAPIAITLERRV